MNPEMDNSVWRRLLWRVARIEKDEVGAAFAGFAYIFTAFTAYTILRPVRETMGITSGVANLPMLFWATLVVTLATQPVFGWLTSRYRRTVFLPWVYAFFAINLVAFYVWFHFQDDHTWIARVFYVWITVFALFVPSVFWSLMVDIFRPEQAKRLFGFLIAGTSTGGIVGPFISATLVRTVGTINLLLFAIFFLTASIFCIRYLTRWHARALNASTPQRASEASSQQDVNRPLGGSLWAGFSLVARSPYLLGIALFMVLLGWASTFLYLQQADLVEKALPDREARTQLFGWVDFSVQALSLLLQLLLFSRLTKWLRPPTLLMCVPLLMAFAYTAFAISPVLTTLLGAMIIRRVGEYGVVRPAREMLYTTVDRETKYKAKNFLDTAAYRIGDATSASVHSGLLALGFSTSGIGWAGVFVSLAWAAVAYRLGRAHDAATLQSREDQAGAMVRPVTTSART